MNRNILKLNDDKTKLIVFKSKRNVNTFAEQNMQVGGTVVGISSKIKNLGVIFDQTLSMQAHVNTIAKNCFYYLKNHSHNTPFPLWGRVQDNCPYFCDFEVGLLYIWVTLLSSLASSKFACCLFCMLQQCYGMVYAMTVWRRRIMLVFSRVEWTHIFSRYFS